MPDSPHLLVIRRRYLGDIVLLGSVFRNLKLHWPEARIAVLCEPAYAGVLPMNPDVAEVFSFPPHALAWPGLAWRLRAARFTHVLDLDNRDKTAFLARATGAPIRVTQRHAESIHFPSFYTAHEVLPADFLAQRHITDLYLRLLEPIGVPVATHEVRLTPRAGDLAFARELLRQSDLGKKKSKILVHPGSRSAWRIWPPAHFAAVIDRVQAEGRADVAVIAGPGEQATVDEIFRYLRTHAVRISATLPVPQLAALFASFDVLLCHDSGPMHLATAVGTRVVALFGSQPLHIWRPLGEKHVALQPPLPCVNCVSPGVCVPQDAYHNHCVRNLTPEQVYAAILSALP
ncbi:MAG: glycosyltransferase family 9 protein [Opitutales bacterium]